MPLGMLLILEDNYKPRAASTARRSGQKSGLVIASELEITQHLKEEHVHIFNVGPFASYDSYTEAAWHLIYSQLAGK